MNNRQIYSHGLLYSVSPDSFSSLHLHDINRKDKLDWEAYKYNYDGDSFVQIVIKFLETTAESWGIIKH
jgi:hypothetical protein